MIIGCDIDGVLADFNSSYIKRVISVTGRDLFPPRPFDVPTWDYPEFYGYTYNEVSAVWTSIKEDETFWRNISEYPDTEASLTYLVRRIVDRKDDLYFIPSRPGVTAKSQTEQWLYSRNPYYRPVMFSVLISSEKGLCAKALKLDAYIDDRWENCIDVSTQSPQTKVFVLDRPWNRDYSVYQHNIRRAYTVANFLD